MKSVNAVIVGAGAAGGIVAKELATAGLSVVLLERGPWYTPHDCRKDDLRNQRTTVLGNAFGPDDDGNPRVVVDGKGTANQVLPSEGGYSNNAACVGGGTLSYGAQAWRYMPQDFRMRSTYGAPQGSSLEDWPISYDDLEPFYEKAEYEIGISGNYSGTPFKGPRKHDLPMPPLPPNREFGILEPAAKRLGLHPFHLPMARNSVPYNGRGPCMRCRWCCGFACEVDAKNGSQNTVLPVALATGNCELRTGCMVLQILTDDHGRATGVAYIDEDGHKQQQYADIVVISGAAIETARLLLNSPSRLFPNGLGNRYDQVGRHLQGHHYTGATGYFDFETYDDMGPGALHTNLMSYRSETVSAGQHQAGTCRMGDDPRASVVNKSCQVHDIDNLFVIDGSVHVTNGGFNPALTIMAVAYYASDALVRNWKGTRFRS